MTCLNLFATKFDQVHDVLSKRAPNLDIILVDTPGQIEVFNWSASGSIILGNANITKKCFTFNLF
jgi:GPN-loop GTPase